MAKRKTRPVSPFVSYPPEIDSPIPGLPTIPGPMDTRLSREKQREVALGKANAWYSKNEREVQRFIEYDAAEGILPEYGEGVVPSSAFKKQSEISANEVIRAVQREYEESLFYGSHSTQRVGMLGGKASLITTPSETLGIIGRRMRAWSSIDPLNVPSNVLQETLGFNETQARMLRSGLSSDSLKKTFSFRLAEREVLGHVSGARIASFGSYLEPNASYISTLDNERVMSIGEEQQRNLVRQLFGRENVVRFSGSGRALTPEQLKKVKISASPERMAEISQIDEVKSFWGRTKERLDAYRQLALEESRNRDIKKPKFSNAHEISDEGSESINAPELYDINPIDERAGDAADKWLAEHAGIEKSIVEDTSGVGGGLIDEIRAGATGDPFQYTNAYKNLKYQYNKAFKVKKGKLVSVNPRFLEEFGGELKNLRSPNINLGKMSIGEAEAAIEDAISGGWKAYHGRGKTKEEVMVSPIENFGQVYVKSGKGHVLLSDLVSRYAVPERATRDPILDVYFKKVAGSERHSIYTAKGQFLGETLGSAGVPPSGVGYAKVFKYQGKVTGIKGQPIDYYNVGWSGHRNQFSWSNFGETEQAIRAGMASDIEDIERNIASMKASGAPGSEIVGAQNQIKSIRQKMSMLREISTVRDLPKAQRVLYSNKPGAPALGKREDLESIYHYGVDLGFGEDRLSSDMFSAKLEDTYRRRAKAHRILSAKYADPESGWWSKLESGIFKNKGWIIAAIGLSAAVISSSISSRKDDMSNYDDVSRSPFGSSTSDQRMFASREPKRQRARIVPEYQGRQGYSTNIDIETTNSSGIDPQELASVMDMHARQSLGTKSTGNTLEISDNSSYEDSYNRKRKYSNMISG